MEPLSIVTPLAALLFAPFLLGVINRVKALFAGRRGQPLLLPYHSIIKLFRKGAVYSTTTSWIFRTGPFIGFAALFVAVCLVPFGNFGAPVSFNGDVLLLAGLLALLRFFTVVAALDTGSPFEGMGASREVFFSALAEPIFLLGLFSVCKGAGVLSLTAISGNIASIQFVPALLTAIGLFMVMLAENARIPVDDPTTHLELTMIHEVMVLDHSCPDFAFISYTAALKLWLFVLIIARIILPFHTNSLVMDATLTIGGMLITTITVGIVESTMARLRLVRVPLFFAAAFAVIVLALFFGSGVIT
jgi:formate hydrogenlyase subunit 4